MNHRMNESEHGVSEARDLAASAGGLESVSARRGLRAWARRMLRTRRKGTVLLFALGVLALLAVIMLVYFSLGRADRSASVALAERSNTAEVGRDVAGYILDVVSRSTTATYVEGRTLDNRLVLRRKGFDIPWTAWTNNSVLNVPTTGTTTTLWSSLNWNASNVWADREAFDPAGTGLTGGSPWLASTEPTYLDFNRDLYAGSLSSLTGGNIAQNQNPWVAHRDWMHISNIAPTGRFVNLYELRPRVGQTSTVNWAVGFDVRPRDMSRRLSLIDSLNGSVVAPSFETDFEQAVGTANNANLYGNIGFDANRPAFWSNRQVGAFRPTSMPTPNNQPGYDPYYAPYQWADADGDGFYDARWQELIDDRGTNGEIRSRVLADTRFRYFVAARIVDLSALVNVNTAGDLLARASVTPDAAQDQGLNNPDVSGDIDRNEDNLLYESVGQAPAIGATPADIDLRRLLTGRDIAEMSQALNSGVTDNSEFYIGIPRDQADPNYGASDALRMRGAGLLAYEALARAAGGSAAPGYDTALDGGVTESNLFRRFRGLEKSVNNSQNEVRAYDVQARARWFSLSTGDAGLMAGEPVRPRFDADDLQELLTRRVVNDSNRLSGLETVLGGRLATNAGAVGVSGSNIANLSPLRENRSTTGELDRTDLNASYKLALTDLRQRLTTLSGARPIRSGARVFTERNSNSSLGPTDAQIASARRNMQRLVDADAMSNVQWRLSANAAQTPFMAQIQGLMVEKVEALRRGTDVAVDAQAALSTVAASSGRVPRPSGRNDLPDLAIPTFVNGGFVGRFTDAQAEAFDGLTARQIADDPAIFNNFRQDLRFVPPTRTILGSVYIDPRIAGWTVDTLPANATQANHANPYFLVNPIFRAYANMLLPFSDERANAPGVTAWDRTETAADPLRTLSYGQSPTNYAQARQANGTGSANGEQRPVRGPEFALRLAGMLTVNAMDMWDNDGLGVPGSGSVDPNNPYGRPTQIPNDGAVPLAPDMRENPDNLSNANLRQNQEPFASRWPLTTAYTLLIDRDIRDADRHHDLKPGNQIRANGGSERGDIDGTGRNAWPFFRAVIDRSSLSATIPNANGVQITPGGKVQPTVLLENTNLNMLNGSADLEVADVDRVPGYSTKLDLDEVRGRDRSDTPSARESSPLGSDARDGFNLSDADRSRRGVSARAINVFGIEAQPVITEVTTLVVYADWTAFAGVPGDDEFRVGSAEVTINGDLSTNNPDMLGKALVVQVANPFDHPIRLDLFQFQLGTPTRVTSGSVTRAEYFGPRFAFPANQEIPPGESRNYLYSVSGVNGSAAGVDAYLTASARVGAIAGTLIPTWTDASDRFMPENITTFTTSDQGGTIQWPAGDTRFGNTVAAPTTALLWKLVKQDDPNTPVRDEFWMLADRLRDPMTARRDPSGASELNAGRATWGRRLPTGNLPVTGTEAGPDPLDPNILATDDPRDNTGFAITLWGSVRRAPQEVFKDGSNNDAIWDSAADGVPAWAVETRTVPEPAAVLNLDQPRQISRNIALCDGQAVDDLATLTESMFTPSGGINNAATGDRTTAGWTTLFNLPAPLVGGMIFDSRFPGETGNGLIQPGFSLPIAETITNKRQPSNPTYTRLSAIRRMPPTRLLLPLFNNRAFSVGPTSSRLRVTDMLLPLAVSPYQDPEARVLTGASNSFDPVEEALDREWTTTTEAFAMSLPYDRTRDARYAGSSTDAYNPGDPQVGNSPTTPGREEKLDDYHPQADRGFPGDIMEDVGSALDRGRLKLDAFVPFLDTTVATGSTPNATFENGDETRGLGIPMALTVFEQFRTLRREGLGDAGANPPPAPYRVARPRRAQGLALLPQGLDGPAGSVTRAVPGLVNLNTASLPVLRSLPLLSPNDWAGAGSATLGRIEWPLRGTSEYPTADGQMPDVAATLMAYRDLTPVRLRTNAAASIFTGPRADFADFAPTQDWTDNNNRGQSVLLSATDARERTAGVAGLLDQPGLRSIGEAGLARMVRDLSGATTRNYVFERNANNIDQLGFLAEPRENNEFNSQDQGQAEDTFGFPRQNSVAGFDRDPGSSSALFRTGSTNANTMPRRAATLTRGSYIDKLDTLAALSNVTSVRSDVFAAWFVVHGYQREDIDRIRSPLDPLVPSLKKRYLMIFDRSNVTQSGQRPRVILFREVPM